MRLLSLLPLAFLSLSMNAQAYPLDGYEDTGIRRVEGARLAHISYPNSSFNAKSTSGCSGVIL